MTIRNETDDAEDDVQSPMEEMGGAETRLSSVLREHPKLEAELIEFMKGKYGPTKRKLLASKLASLLQVREASMEEIFQDLDSLIKGSSKRQTAKYK